MDVLLSAEGVSKKYARSMKRSLDYGVRDAVSEMAGRRRSEKLRPEEFWALKDVSFQVARGDCLAVLGGNGAGKSTLLKLLSGILLPDGGRIQRFGRMEKMIELSGGFSPHMTGRENVALRARMLGLGPSQLRSRMDEIAEFAEIGDFMDAPVQFYSSGMRSRLGFALSVVMEPDILLIDEVLAVGDLGFRMKCYERVDQMRRTSAVVLVTHSMNHVARMATSTLVLHKGRVVHSGDVQEGIGKYHELSGADRPKKDTGHYAERIGFSVHDGQGRVEDGASIPFGTRLQLWGHHSADVPVTLSVILGEVRGHALMDWNSRRSGFVVAPGEPFNVDLGAMELSPGSYQLTIVGFGPDGAQVFLSSAMHFKLTGDYFNSIRLQPRGAWSHAASVPADAFNKDSDHVA